MTQRMMLVNFLLVAGALNMCTAQSAQSQLLRMMSQVNATNCQVNRRMNTLQINGQLKRKVKRLPEVSVVKNLVNQRALFFSSIFQQLNGSYLDFTKQPGLGYYYASVSADMSSTLPGVMVSSSLLFDVNCTYANWMRTLWFNYTLEKFGPTAKWFDGDNRTLQVAELGPEGPGTNYQEKIQPWIRKLDPRKYHSFPHKYDNFYGPSVEDHLIISNPQFDCGRTNRWLLSVLLPIYDYMPRYTMFQRLRAARIVGFARIQFDLEVALKGKIRRAPGRFVRKRARLVARYKRNSGNCSEQTDFYNHMRTRSIVKKLSDNQVCSNADNKYNLEEQLSKTIEKQFKTQALAALRLAHFVGNYQQNYLDKKGGYTYTTPSILKDKKINKQEISSELGAIIMSDRTIQEAALQLNDTLWLARKHPEGYRNNIYSRPRRWDVVSSPKRVEVRASMRTDLQGKKPQQQCFYKSPMYYATPTLDEGRWNYTCVENTWMASYSAPIWYDGQQQGFVRVSMDIRDMDIQQCSEPQESLNVFKNTALCDYMTSRCVFQPGGGMNMGAGYRCQCLPGFNTYKRYNYFTGLQLEREWRKKRAGKSNVFRQMKCR